MAKIDGTNIDISFIQKPLGHHPHIYYGPGEGSLTLASVNAGNSQDLYVGGGGINGGFATVLGRTQTTDDYEARHKALLADAAKSGSAFKRYDSDDPTLFSYVDASELLQKANWHEGVCFVDVFAPGRCPAGNTKNAAMLYAAPPHGDYHPMDADFLDAIGKMGRNIVRCVASYNALAPKQSVPVVEAVRLCLYSSVICNSNAVPLDQIALTIFDGVSGELAAQPSCGIKELQMPWAAKGDDKTDGPLFRAVKEKLGL